MNRENLSKGTAWVTTYRNAEAEKVARARKKLLDKREVTFNVCCLDYNRGFLLMNDTTDFIVAKEMGIKIKLIHYDVNDFVHKTKFDFTKAQLLKSVDENGNIMVGDLFDNFIWTGNTYEIEAEVIVGEAVYTLTPIEQEMKLSTPQASGVEIHKAYVGLGMTQDSDIHVYRQYYFFKDRHQF